MHIHAGEQPLPTLPVGCAYATDRTVPATTGTSDLPPGRWAISATGRHSVERLGREIEI